MYTRSSPAFNINEKVDRFNEAMSFCFKSYAVLNIQFVQKNKKNNSYSKKTNSICLFLLKHREFPLLIFLSIDNELCFHEYVSCCGASFAMLLLHQMDQSVHSGHELQR